MSRHCAWGSANGGCIVRSGRRQVEVNHRGITFGNHRPPEDLDWKGSEIVSVQDSLRAHLVNLSRVLLRLTYSIADAERLSYERMHSRIASPENFGNWC
jgi:hypothetical protein